MIRFTKNAIIIGSTSTIIQFNSIQLQSDSTIQSQEGNQVAFRMTSWAITSTSTPCTSTETAINPIVHWAPSPATSATARCFHYRIHPCTWEFWGRSQSTVQCHYRIKIEIDWYSATFGCQVSWITFAAKIKDIIKSMKFFC